MAETKEERIKRVAQATIRKHAGSPLTSTPEFWERIVTTILDEAAKPEVAAAHRMLQSLECFRAGEELCQELPCPCAEKASVHLK